MFNQLTQRDIDAMQKEIEERKLVIRPKLLEDVKEARAHGDLSENFEPQKLFRMTQQRMKLA